MKVFPGFFDAIQCAMSNLAAMVLAIVKYDDYLVNDIGFLLMTAIIFSLSLGWKENKTPIAGDARNHII